MTSKKKREHTYNKNATQKWIEKNTVLHVQEERRKMTRENKYDVEVEYIDFWAIEAYMCICVYICVYKLTCVYMRICAQLCLNLSVYVLYTHIFMYIFAHICFN